MDAPIKQLKRQLENDIQNYFKNFDDSETQYSIEYTNHQKNATVVKITTNLKNIDSFINQLSFLNYFSRSRPTINSTKSDEKTKTTHKIYFTLYPPSLFRCSLSDLFIKYPRFAYYFRMFMLLLAWFTIIYLFWKF